MQIKQELRQIYSDLCSGKLSQKGALKRIKAVKLQEKLKKVGALQIAPVWRAIALESSSEASKLQYAQHHIILCELSIDARKLEALVAPSHCLWLQAGEEKNIAERYSEYALACFAQIRTLLRSKPQGRMLVQIVVAGHEEQAVLAGLTGLLKTAALENPQLMGQLLLVPPETTAEELSGQLQGEKAGALEAQVKYGQGVRQVLRWEEIATDVEKPAL